MLKAEMGEEISQSLMLIVHLNWNLSFCFIFDFTVLNSIPLYSFSIVLNNLTLIASIWTLDIITLTKWKFIPWKKYLKIYQLDHFGFLFLMTNLGQLSKKPISRFDHEQSLWHATILNALVGIITQQMWKWI